MSDLETGIQFHLPTYAHVPLPHLVELASRAEAKGVDQIWVTDNLRSRQSFVVLAAMASHLEIKLGTAVTVQYFRNPVDLADSIATLSELMDGRELSVGLGRGNPAYAIAHSDAAAGQRAPGDRAELATAPGRRGGLLRRLPQPVGLLPLQSPPRSSS